MSDRGRQGFSSMDRERVRKIASLGGKAAHEKGVAHKWTPDSARIAGIKGGAGNKRRWEKKREEPSAV